MIVFDKGFALFLSDYTYDLIWLLPVYEWIDSKVRSSLDEEA